MIDFGGGGSRLGFVERKKGEIDLLREPRRFHRNGASAEQGRRKSLIPEKAVEK